MKPVNPYDSLLLVASRLLAEGRSAEAIERLRRATTERPDGYAAWLNLGLALLQQGEEHAAAQAFARFLSCCPQDEGLAAFRDFAARTVSAAGLVVPTAPGEAQAEVAAESPLEMFTVEIDGKRLVVTVRNDTGVPQAELLALIDELVRLPTWLDADLFLDDHPELLSSIADVLIDHLAMAQEDDGMRRILELNREILRRCREGRRSEAFAEAMGTSPIEFEMLRRAVREIQPKLQELVAAADLEQRRRVLERSPELIEDDATFALLAHLRDLQAPGGGRELLEWTTWMLHLCRTEGIERGLHLAHGGAGDDGELSEVDELLARAQRSLDTAAADRAVAILRAAAEPASVELLGRLGNALAVRSELTGSGEDRDEAITLLSRAAASVPATTAWSFQGNLASLLQRRFESHGDPADLEQAIELAQSVLDDVPPGTSQRGTLLNTLGGLWLRHAELSGRFDDLDRAVAAYRSAIALAEPGSPSWRVRHANLGLALSDRFAAGGRSDDADAGLAAYDVALADDELPPSRLVTSLTGLGGLLRQRAGLLGDPADLDRAIVGYRRALQLVIPGTSDHGYLENNLGLALRDRYLASGDAADLDAAVAAAERALQHAAPTFFDLPQWRENLANSLRLRYELAGRPEDAERALRLFDEVLAALPSGSPRWAECRGNAASLLLVRYRRGGDTLDLAAAITGYTEALAGLDPLERPSSVLSMALVLGELAASQGDWSRCAAVLEQALTALAALYRDQLAGRARDAWLGRAGELHQLAALALARTGAPGAALLVLERGRARGLSEALASDQADLERLIDTGHVGLHERYRAAAAEFRSVQGRARAEADPSRREALARALRWSRSEMDAVVREIRSLPGWVDFMAEPELEDVLAAARTAPLAYLAATPAGGLGLVARDGAVTPVWLPRLGGTELDERLVGYLRAFAQSRAAPRDAAARSAWEAALDETTRWLWDAAMGTLLETLAGAPSAVLVPTGALGLLPFHVAWREMPTAPVGRLYALDLVEWRYAPNARALTTAYRLAATSRADALLAVADPTTDAAPRLAYAGPEAAVALTAFRRGQVLAGREATHAAVLAALPSFDVVHFACHATARLDEPLASGLLLAGGEWLEVRHLLAARTWRARLGVLSACETAVVGTKLPDEVMGLPGGLLQAGVAGVIASLWAVPDLGTALLMSKLYKLWRGDGLEPAASLVAAQRWLRDTTNEQKLQDLGVSSSVTSLTEALNRREPGARDFTHPRHWAAFTYVGA